MKRLNISALFGTLLLSAFLLLGVAQQVYAAPTDHSVTVGSEQLQTMFCDIGGCQMEHEDCFEHCLNQSDEDNGFVAVLSSNDHDAVATAEITDPIETPRIPHDHFCNYASDRAPPTIVFLRSVIKIE